MKAVRSAVLMLAAGRAATLMAVRKDATAPHKPTNTMESACRRVSSEQLLYSYREMIFCSRNIKACGAIS